MNFEWSLSVQHRSIDFACFIFDYGDVYFSKTSAGFFPLKDGIGLKAIAGTLGLVN